MLDANIKTQIKNAWKVIDQKLTWKVADSEHPSQTALVEFIEEITGLSDYMYYQVVDQNASNADFGVSLHIEDKNTGISFQGIPGGHELTSFVLAPLQAIGKAKPLDQVVRNTIKSLDVPLHFETYVSLTCTNCPDAVQALNSLSVVSDNITHTMIDGALFEERVKEQGVQAVPTVLLNGKVFHVGRATLGDLYNKILKEYGSHIQNETELNLNHQVYDVAVIGGGPAGVSSAIYSARKGLKTLVIADRMGGQVADTQGIENLISTIYTKGPELVRDMENHLREYDVDIMEHQRVECISEGETKGIELVSGNMIQARSIIVATGAKWRELNVPGEKEYLGRGVAFCPHCDGPFYKGKDVAVIGGGNSGVEAALDLVNICNHVTLIEYGDKLIADQVLIDKVEGHDRINIILNAQTQEISGNGEKVTGLRYKDRVSESVENVTLDGVFVQIGLSPNSSFLEGVVDRTSRGEVRIDEKGATSVEGIYAAGDVTTVPYKQIVVAMGEGAKAALGVFEYLLTRTEEAVPG